MEELKKEIMSEILDELEDIDIGELIKELLEMDFEKIELVKQYVSLLKKSN
jgi:ATP-dependent RNA circularization protein (DNA/RNA ligase family)